MSEKQMQSLAKEARQFVFEYVDLLFGPAHTTKVHRFANHLLAALLRNGNLWECDTSENEALHGPCKKMYARTNKRGPSIVLQMMRAAENQAEVLRELRLLNDEDEDGGGGVNHLLLLSEDIVDGVDVGTAPTLSLSRSSRGLQTSVAEAEQLPGMALPGIAARQCLRLFFSRVFLLHIPLFVRVKCVFGGSDGMRYRLVLGQAAL